MLLPTKYHWRERADLGLIEHSLKWLSGWDEPVALPQIGCGFGELNWEAEVEPSVEHYLGEKDNFLLVLMPDSVRWKYPRAFGKRRA